MGPQGRRLLAALLSLLGIAGCRRSGAISTYPGAPLVLISIDTLRSDHLPAYGYRGVATPNVDALAREGIVFEDVFSHCPLTLPSHASLLTGLLPPRHGVRDNLGFTLAAGHATLATRLASKGYATGAAVSAYVLRSSTGIGRGFTFYDDDLPEAEATDLMGSAQRDGAVSVASLLAWTQGQKAPFFAFLHLYEPHAPYTPPAPYDDAYRANSYDGEVAYADDCVGRFVAGLKARGLYEQAVIAVTSDHGEGLKDHGEQEHGLLLYREAVQVPLIVRLPGAAAAGRRVRGSVAHVDVPATLLDLVGVTAEGLDGVSARPALQSGTIEPRRVYAETYFPRYHFGWSELLAVTEGRFRYVRGPTAELFDLSQDPGERSNLAAARAASLKPMEQWLDGQRRAGPEAPEAVTPEVRERLKALGYVGGSTSRAPVGATLAHPRDKVAVYEQYRSALVLQTSGRLEDAVLELRGVVAKEPGMADAWQSLGDALGGLGRLPEAVAAFEHVLATDPTSVEAHIPLARLHGLMGRAERAAKHAEIAASRDAGRGYETLALLLLDQRRFPAAAEAAAKSLAAEPRRVMANFALGVARQELGQCEEALQAFRRAEEERVRRPPMVVRALHAGMGDCLARLGRAAEAEQAFLAELRAIPTSREGRVGLATLYHSQGRRTQAIEVLTSLASAEGRPSPEAYRVVIGGLRRLGERDVATEWVEKARAVFPGDPRFR